MEDIKKLVQRAQQGDKDAFGLIYKRYYEKIYRYCRINTGSVEVAQDICQESFVKAFKAIKKFKTDGNSWSIQAFLFKIARNLIIDASRKKKELKLEEFENLESDEDLIDIIDRKEDTRKIRWAMEKLPDEEKQIVILKYFEDMESREIAEVLGIKDGAVRVRIHRVLEKLKIIFEGYGRTN